MKCKKCDAEAKCFVHKEKGAIDCYCYDHYKQYSTEITERFNSKEKVYFTVAENE